MAHNNEDNIKMYEGLAEYLETTYKDRKIKLLLWEGRGYGVVDFVLDGNVKNIYRLTVGPRRTRD